jgi:hypothetical protein
VLLPDLPCSGTFKLRAMHIKLDGVQVASHRIIHYVSHLIRSNQTASKPGLTFHKESSLTAAFCASTRTSLKSVQPTKERIQETSRGMHALHQEASSQAM